PDGQADHSTSKTRRKGTPMHLVSGRTKLDFESDIGHKRDIGTRLIDDPSNDRNFALWVGLLRFRQRHYGVDGVRDIWKGLTERNGRVDLPVDGYYADILWKIFIQAALEDNYLLRGIRDYSRTLWKKYGTRWYGVY